MSKLITTKPVLIILYGYPGSGKTHFARQMTETLKGAHLQADKIRDTLFEKPRYDEQENMLVDHLMKYMTEEFISAGLSVIYDSNATRLSHRRELRNLANKFKAESVLVWIQIDGDSAQARLTHRDKRKTDDKYAIQYNDRTFQEYIQKMQNPKNEDYIVISGKHTFSTQRSAVIKKLYDLGLINNQVANPSVVKPGLVNLIPNQMRSGRVDETRRDIYIR